jgi:UDP-glucose 4-epimerase
MKFEGKTVLVTGGAGFIGSHIVSRALREGAGKVIALDNFVGSKQKNIRPFLSDARFEIVAGDVRDVDVITPLVQQSNFVFHEAASKLVVSLKNPRIDLATNIIGTFNILEAARDSDIRIVHASTGSVLGNSVNGGMKEDHAPHPSTLYGISKLAAEKYCQFYAKELGVKVSILRYFHVFGPRQDYRGEAGVINIFLSRVLKGEAPTIFGTGEQIRCFTYVEDVVAANLLLAANDDTIGEVYNVASKTRISVKDLADLLISKYGNGYNGSLKPQFGPARVGENLKPIPHTSKIESLGFGESISFEEGLDNTKSWIENDVAEETY